MDLQPYLPHIALFLTCVSPGLGVLAFVILSILEYWRDRKRENMSYVQFNRKWKVSEVPSPSVPFPPEAMEKIMQIMSESLDSEAAYTIAAAAPEPGKDLTRASLELAAKLMSLMPPAPVAFWFIDRDAEYQQFMNLIPQSQNAIDRLMGLPVRQWSVREIEKRIRELMEVDGRTEEYCLEIFPFRTAGVWVEMSNGEHQEIEIPHRPGWTPK